MSFDYANVGYKESGRLYNTAQHNKHNQTQQQLVVKVEYRGGNVFPTTNSEGGIYLHVLEDR